MVRGPHVGDHRGWKRGAEGGMAREEGWVGKRDKGKGTLCHTVALEACCLFFFGLFAISWAVPAAYGGSQARGRMGAVAASLHHSHSNVGSESDLYHSSRQCQILNPLSKARDQTCLLTDTSQVLNC